MDIPFLKKELSKQNINIKTASVIHILLQNNNNIKTGNFIGIGNLQYTSATSNYRSDKEDITNLKNFLILP